MEGVFIFRSNTCNKQSSGRCIVLVLDFHDSEWAETGESVVANRDESTCMRESLQDDLWVRQFPFRQYTLFVQFASRDIDL